MKWITGHDCEEIEQRICSKYSRMVKDVQAPRGDEGENLRTVRNKPVFCHFNTCGIPSGHDKIKNKTDLRRMTLPLENKTAARSAVMDMGENIENMKE